jgi:2-iminoacetate synthase
MSFAERLARLAPEVIEARLEGSDGRAVERALAAPRLVVERHAPILLSAAARDHLEPMARRAREITRRRFGRTMTLYAPVYLSSYCVNGCRYCGFSSSRNSARRRLTVEEAVREAEVLTGQGIRHLLLVTGEDPARYGLESVCEVARALRARTSAASVSVEIFPCDRAGYRRLAEAGVDGLVLYQETYQRQRYAELHPFGPKRDFDARLAAVEAGGAAGFRSLGVGALLGLAPHRVDAVYLALHADHLTRAFPGARIAVSLPRLRPAASGEPTVADHRVGDADLVQLIVGMRLLFPDAEIVVSTREPAELRDRLVHLGVTRMSAGSCTVPGGYAGDNDGAGQFATDDRRSVAAVAAGLRAAGLDVVTKDFDDELMAAGTPEEW